MNGTQKRSQAGTGSFNKRLIVYLIAAAVLAAAATRIGASVTLKYFDGSSRFFTDSVAWTVICITAGVAVIFAISSVFFFKKGRVQLSFRLPTALRFAHVLPALAAINCGYAVVSLLRQKASLAQATGEKTNSYTTVLVIIMFLACILYSVARIVKLNDTVALVAGCGQIALFLYVVATLYLDLAVAVVYLDHVKALYIELGRYAVLYLVFVNYARK